MGETFLQKLSNVVNPTPTKPERSFIDRLADLTGKTVSVTRPPKEEPKPQPGEFTMYNPVAGQTDSSPRIMASGKEIYDGAIATSDYSMPLGTIVHIPELKKDFVVEDRMNRRYSPEKYGKTVFDILNLDATSTGTNAAKQFGRQQLHFIIKGHDKRKETKAEPKKKSTQSELPEKSTQSELPETSTQ